MPILNTLPQLLDHFHDEQACKDYLETVLHDNKMTCPYCFSISIWKTKPGYKCATCRKGFTIKVNTIFESSKLSLRTWFAAIYLITTNKKGISSLQLASTLGITQKSSWFLNHRIREAMTQPTTILSGEVEADETFIGGQHKNKHKARRKEMNEKGTGYVNKTPILGILQRKGKVMLHVLSHAAGETIKPILRNAVDRTATLITDGFGGYHNLHKEFKAHEIINHAQDEFKRGPYHTNSIEGFFSLIKRGIVGTYHFLSPKHLQRYCHEFAYRYNSRDISNGQRFENAVRSIAGVRLKYSELIGK